MGRILPFPDCSAILVDRDSDGKWTVEPYLCPRAAGTACLFDHGGDALEYAEPLAREAGTGWCLMCDP